MAAVIENHDTDDTGEAEIDEAALTEFERRMSALVPGRASYAGKLAKLKQTYFCLERDDEFRLALSDLGAEAIARGRSGGGVERLDGSFLTLTGNPGAGKSRMLRTALKICGILEPFPFKGHELRLAVRVTAPSPFNRELFSAAILRAVGMETDRRLTANTGMRIVTNLMRRTRTSLVIIDEAQHMLRSESPKVTSTARDTLKNFSADPDWPVSFLLVGTRRARRIIATDNQVRHRNIWMDVPPIRIDTTDGTLFPHDMDLVQDAIDEAISRADLSDGLDDRADVAVRLVFASGLEYGRLFEFIRLAAQNALSSGSSSLTRRDFEEALRKRTGCSADRNSFRTAVTDFRIIRHWLSDEDEEFFGEDDVLVPDREPTRRVGGRGR
ncbi:hypothetical protein FP2506_01150 [Fulvimarina pelagi HTCC2506]|uniref:AAA+ ATPase domain-containing protein n=1 Tax=Fulvimarina pelagi HTCC2506 TaxID=314231 RepID=Q0G267_9HYPH|nr:ATP-binding protein [Fulvimarina pelagi]EAU41331.1 hypothetical protein FP2506_01150 [Fulvimarina pelagi HTCC2506]